MSSIADKNSETKAREKGLPFFGIPKMKPLLAKYKKALLIIVLTNVFCSGAEVFLPVMQSYALNHYVGEGTTDTLALFTVLYILIIAVSACASYLCIRVAMSTELRMDRDMRNRAFSHLQELSFDYYNSNSVGYIHARVMSDTSRIGDLFTWQINDTAMFLIYIVGSFAVMFATNPRLALIVLVVVPIIALFFSLFQGKLFALHRQVREINSRITGNFNEGITGAKTIKTLVIEDRIDGDFRAETENMHRKSLETARHRGMFSAVTGLASSAALALVLWKGGIIAKEQVGTFSMFMTYAQGLMEPVRWLVETLALFVAGKVNIERYSNLCEAVPTVKDSQKVTEKYGDCFNPLKENWEPIKGDIEFENVDFKYPDGEEYIFKNFSLSIPFGTNIAIVGETGAGKSTLANLICRFYEPTSGRILIDGTDSRERSQLWLHSALGYVLQTPHLFSGTVRENLIYGNPDATEEEILAAIDMVSAGSVIEKLEKGLDTDVGEGGDLLSTGEKQLISFARAILADPRIIVLDEATASVDTITEQKIQSAIDRIIKGRTSIVIAHRLSTVKNADLILVVKDGKIVEQGKHSQLLALGGEYSRLWNRQYEDEAVSRIWEDSRNNRQ